MVEGEELMQLCPKLTQCQYAPTKGAIPHNLASIPMKNTSLKGVTNSGTLRVIRHFPIDTNCARSEDCGFITLSHKSLELGVLDSGFQIVTLGRRLFASFAHVREDLYWLWGTA